MKALFIGGTGTISSSISALCVSRGWDLTLLNRGNADARMPQGARAIHADIRDEAAVRDALKGQAFDVVADFIAYTPVCFPAERDSTFLSARRRRIKSRCPRRGSPRERRCAILTGNTAARRPPAKIC